MALTGEGPIAIALVVDASLTLAAQWIYIFTNYFPQLLKRLAEGHPSQKMILGFVSYGNPETRPTPLVCRRFFHELVGVTKMLRDNTENMGIGMGDTGSNGMSALEGLVAAVEMFDTLLTSFPAGDNVKIPICHVIHVTASPVTDTVNPSYNVNPLFDDVTWDTLPEEFKKRHINFSCINTGSEIPAITKLHAALENPCKPWFQLHTGHTLLLSGYPASTVKAAPATKRPPDGQPEKAPEQKRSRVEPSVPPPSAAAPAPVVSSALPPASQPIVLNSAPSAQSSALPPPAAVSQFTLANGLRPMDIITRYQILEGKMHEWHKQLTDARSSGNLQQAAAAEGEINKFREHFMKMKAVVTQLINNPNLASIRPQIVAHLQASKQAAAGNSLSINTGAPSIPTVPPPMQPSLSLSDLNSGGHNFAGSQIGLNRSVSGAMPGPMHNPAGPSSMMAPPVNMGQPSLNQQTAVGGGKPNIPIWQGPLCWSGIDGTSGKREMQTFVTALTQSNGDFRVHTWPSSFMLTPTQTPAVSLPEIQAWVKKTGPALCVFVPQQQPPTDKANNELHFKALISLLTSKKVYALAAWTLPSGSRNPACLLFPLPNNSLAGAFFPVDGIQEYPRPAMLNNLNISFPPQLEAQLQKLSVDERNMVMARYLQQAKSRAGGMPMSMGASLPAYMQQQQQQQQQHQNQQHATGTGAAMNMNMNMNAGMNIMNFGLPNMGQPQPNAGLPRPMQGFSNEIIQSFMQRNDGQSG